MAQVQSSDRSNEAWNWRVESGGPIPAHRGPVAAALSGRFRALAPILLLALVGALLGFAGGALTLPRPSAVTRVQVLPDPVIAGDPGSGPDEDRFTQGQVLVLGGDDLATDVTRELGLGEPVEVTATQVGTTDVVEVTVRAESKSAAVRATAALLETYRDQRTRLFSTRVDRAQGVIDRQIATLERARRDARTDLEYSRLLGARNELQLLRDSGQIQVTTVMQPRAVEQNRWARAGRTAVMGLVLGALLGLLISLLRSRSSPALTVVPRSQG